MVIRTDSRACEGRLQRISFKISFTGGLRQGLCNQYTLRQSAPPTLLLRIIHREIITKHKLNSARHAMDEEAAGAVAS
jgi:hypothetical protein